MADDVEIAVLARGSAGFSGADLANLVNEAALNAARYNQKVVRMHDFEFAKDKVLMGSERRSMIISDAEKRVTAIHEAGHALLTVLLPHADPIHKVTIIPRGMALGLTQQLPTDEKHNYSQDYSEDTALKIDQEVKLFVTQNYERSHRLLAEHKEKLVKIADALLSNEVLDAEQVRRLAAGLPLEIAQPAASRPAVQDESEGRARKERSPIVPALNKPLPQE